MLHYITRPCSLPVILFFLPLRPSLPLTLHSYPLNHTLITFTAAHTHTHTSQECTLTRITADPFPPLPHSTPGYWTNGSDSTPTANARITGLHRNKGRSVRVCRGKKLRAPRGDRGRKKPDGERKRRVMKRRRRERRDDSGRLTGSSGRREMWKCVSV